MAKGGISNMGLMKKGRGLAKVAAQKASGGKKGGNPFAAMKKGGKGKMAPPFGKKVY